MIPDDPVMLLSYVNTQLRDFYPDFAGFCAEKGIDPEAVYGQARQLVSLCGTLVSGRTRPICSTGSRQS